MIVAAGALHRDAEQRVQDVLHVAFEDGVAVDANLVGIAVAFAGAVGGVADEVRGGKAFDHVGRHVAGWRVTHEFVAGDLLLHEAVVRLVGVEGLHDVVAVLPGERAVAIGVEVAVGVGVSRGVEPNFAPTLPVVRRRQHAIDHLLIGIRRFVREVGIDLGDSRRQTGEVERDAANQRGAIRLRIEAELLRFQCGENEPIHIGAGDAANLGRLGPSHGRERTVRFHSK